MLNANFFFHGFNAPRLAAGRFIAPAVKYQCILLGEFPSAAQSTLAFNRRSNMLQKFISVGFVFWVFSKSKFWYIIRTVFLRIGKMEGT